MFFETVFASLLMLALGLGICAFGFQLFVILLPVFGFFAGFTVTAQAIQQLFGIGFLSTISSWFVGFVVGLLFAVVAYFFYYAAVAILAGAVGYELGVGLMAGFGVSSGFLQFLVGLVLALALIAAVILLNAPKLLIVVLTALAGAGLVVSSILIGLGRVPLTALQFGIVGDVIRLSWFWFLVFLAVTGVGIAVQMLLPTGYTLTPYDANSLYQQSPGTPTEPASSMTPGMGPEVPST